MAKLKIKTGDTVEVISGKDKGKQGEVLRSYPKEGKVVVAGVAVVKKSQRAAGPNQQGGIVEQEAAIDASNVALVASDGKPTRVGFKLREDGSKVRISKRTGEEL